MTRPVSLCLTLLALLLVACGSGGESATESIDRPIVGVADGADSSRSESPASPSIGETALEPNLAGFGETLDTALDIPERDDSPVPVSIRYEAIGVTGAPIDAVGVEENGEMEIPGAEEVGWYEYGPRPGQAGSAVLAAHIAFNGVDGVFRELGSSEIEDRFTIVFSDDTEQTYRIVERSQYDKDQLPFERVFARTGSPVITLISCGGDFQQSIQSYEDNIVAYAVPDGDRTPVDRS